MDKKAVNSYDLPDATQVRLLPQQGLASVNHVVSTADVSICIQTNVLANIFHRKNIFPSDRLQQVLYTPNV